MRNSLKVLLHNFNQADIWALTGLLQVFFQLLCYRFAAVLEIIVQLDHTFFCQLSDRWPHI